MSARATLLALVLVPACGGEAWDELPPVEDSPEPVAADGPLFEPARASGLDFTHELGGVGNRELPETMGGGLALLDAEGDGDLDVYLVQSGPVRTSEGTEERAGAANALFLNDGAAHFTRSTGDGPEADTGYGMGASAGDLDGDGLDDLVVLNWGPSRLLVNESDADAARFRATEPR